MPLIETNRAKIIRNLEQGGWSLARHGSEHDVYAHASKSAVAIVPRHRTISTGVARQIAKAAGWI